MSDKRGIFDNECLPVLLKKKSNRKKKPQKLEKDFDMNKFKDKILFELANENISTKQEQDAKTIYDSTEYDKRFKEYLNEGFSYNTLMFVNRIILDSTTLPSGLRNNFALHKILFNIVKTLMMNELEIVYLSLYLDKMGWSTDGYQIDENLMMTGISVKIYLNSNFSFIISHLSKKMKIEERFNSWLTIKKDYYNSMTIAPRELNEKYKLLSKPFNSFCKQNYIDFNFIVDKILQMSLPYSESKLAQDKIEAGSHEQSFYEQSIHLPKHPDTTGNSHNGASVHRLEHHLGSQNMSYFPIPIENMHFNQGNYILKSDNMKSPIENINSINNINNIGNMNNSTNNLQHINHNSNFNLGVGRMDSFNILLRDGSFYNFENDRYLLSRGTSQLMLHFPDEGQDESKNIFSKNNAFRNVSVQSINNDNLANYHSNYQTVSSVNLPYPKKNIMSDLNNETKKVIQAKISDANHLMEEVNDTARFSLENKIISNENLTKTLIENPQMKQNNQSTNLGQLFPNSEKQGQNTNFFKKLKEEQLIGPNYLLQKNLKEEPNSNK